MAMQRPDPRGLVDLLPAREVEGEELVQRADHFHVQAARFRRVGACGYGGANQPFRWLPFYMPCVTTLSLNTNFFWPLFRYSITPINAAPKSISVFCLTVSYVEYSTL